MISELIKLSKSSSKYVVGAEGNVSCRFDNGFYIKASGKSLENLSEKDLVFCNEDGTYDESSVLRPSIETSFHAWLFKNIPDINYISHTHPINTLKILCSGEVYNFSKKRLFPDQVVFNGVESCLVEYHHPGEDLLNGLKTSFNAYFDKHQSIPKIILLKNHGIITFGKTINECIISSDICEKSSEIFLGSLFKPSYLSNYYVNRIVNDENEKYRQKLNEK